MIFSLENNTALVTGASGSIGRAIAIAMAKNGATVGLSGTNETSLNNLVVTIKELTGKDAFALPCNLAKSDDVSELIKRASDVLGGRLDILVNNAGINNDMLFGKMKEETLDDVMKVNLNAPFVLCRNAISLMSNNRFGRIINISSVVGLTGNIGQVNYCASKAAIIGMSKAIALEVARKGITVNCIAPGAVNSPMIEKLSDANKEKFVNNIPMRRIGDPEDIANACCFLASKEAGYITGQTIHVNGGMLMV